MGQMLIWDNCKDDAGMDLAEAFWVVRLYCDMREEDKWEREQETARQAGFSPTQVAQFRQSFVEADADGSGELSDAEILKVFDGLMALSMLQVHRLKSEMSDMGDSIDFQEFLRLMAIIVGKSLDDGVVD